MRKNSVKKKPLTACGTNQMYLYRHNENPKRKKERGEREERKRKRERDKKRGRKKTKQNKFKELKAKNIIFDENIFLKNPSYTSKNLCELQVG